MELLDITTSTLVALLGIWMAIGRGPWILRFLIVSSLLLTPLLIPAYELVIQHALAVVLIAVGIKIYQGNRPWGQRYSLRTLLLGTTAIAIVSAVLVNAPLFELNQWVDFLGIAMAIASITLIWLWVIFSKKSWWQKTRIFFYSVFFLAVGDHVIIALSNTELPIRLGLSWDQWSSYFRSTEWIEWWLEYHLLGAIVASVLLVSLLFLAKWSRWFEVNATSGKGERSIAALVSRTALLCLLVLVMSLPSYVFYRLMTPTPIPVVELPVPNGYDDLIAAGKMIDDDIDDVIASANTLNDFQLRAQVERISDAIERIDLGLSRKFVFPNQYLPYGAENEVDTNSVFNVFFALALHLKLSQREGTSSEYREDILRVARFSYAVDQGGGIKDEHFFLSAILSSRKQFYKLAPADCRLLAQELCKLDMLREPHSVHVARQLIVDQHTNWFKHVQQILYPVWSEEEQYELGYWELYGLIEYRLIVVELAVNGYLGEMGQLPDAIDALVPRYLPHIPDDPFGTGPIKYLAKNGKYKIYSNGHDRDDDGGVPEDLTTTQGGDMVYEGPPQPSLEQGFAERLNFVWNNFNAFVRYLDSLLE